MTLERLSYAIAFGCVTSPCTSTSELRSGITSTSPSASSVSIAVSRPASTTCPFGSTVRARSMKRVICSASRARSAASSLVAERGLSAYDSSARNDTSSISRWRSATLDAKELHGLGLRLRRRLNELECVAQPRAVRQREHARALDCAVDAHEDRGDGAVRNHGELVAGRHRHAFQCVERVVLAKLAHAGLARDAHVRRCRPRPCQRKHLGGRGPLVAELEAVRIEDVARHADGVVPRRDDERVAVLELHGREPAFEQEFVKIERRALFAAANQLHVDVAAARRVDAAGASKIAEHRLGGRAGILPGRPHEARDEQPHGLRRVERRVDVHVVAVHAADGRADDVVQLVVAHAREPDGAHVRHEHVALRVDRLHGLEGERAPDPEQHAVADREHVIRVEPDAVTLHGAAKELLAEHRRLVGRHAVRAQQLGRIRSPRRQRRRRLRGRISSP